METGLYSATDKAYTMLFITDYTKASDKERGFVNAIRNNLLDKDPDAATNKNEGPWKKLYGLPKIIVSIIDIAETRQKAYDMLDRNRYDVIFVSAVVDGKPVGAGFLRNVLSHHPDALIIPFISAGQIAGAQLSGGRYNDGTGIKKIYDLGIYSCMVRKNVDLGELIRMIHAGGRTKEDAFKYYGLYHNPEFLKEQTGTSHMLEEKEPAVVSSEAGINKRHEGFMGGSSEKQEAASEMPESRWEKKQETFNRDTADMSAGNEDKIRQEMARGADEEMEDPERKLPYKERRKLEKKRLQEQRRQERERAAMSDNSRMASDDKLYEHRETEMVDDKPQMEQPAMALGAAEDETDRRGKFAKYDPDQSRSSEAEEMREIMISRGRSNSSLASSGVLQGKVVFAKGNTAWIEFDKNIEDIGLSVVDLYQMPVVVPYTKFGDVN